MLRKTKSLAYLFIFTLIQVNNANAQYGPGYNKVTLNWDNLDYFSAAGTYSTSYLSSSDILTQKFAFGKNRLTITLSTDISKGENGTHTGDLPGYTGDDVQFTPTAAGQTIVLSFENPVIDPNFTLYDIDNSASLTITAINSLGSPANINVVTQSPTILTIGGTLTAPTITANSTNLGNSDNQGSATITATGSIKSITITVAAPGITGWGTDQDIWLSDITACTAGDFAMNYYAVSKPFSGMPGYVLHAFDTAVYAVDPATGVTKMLFSDPTGNINSMAYDPYNRILYYVYSLTSSPGTNKKLMKYDFNTETKSVALNDVTTIGIPVVGKSSGEKGTGVESGAAAFYDGSLYLGIEATNSSNNSGREGVVWRIDFDASNNPYRASQAYAMPMDNGSGTLIHDWGDISVYNGILYDFDGAGSSTQSDIYEMNLITGNSTRYTNPTGYSSNKYVPSQTAIDWKGDLFQIADIDPGKVNTTPYIAQYNKGAGTIGPRVNITSSPAYAPAYPSIGDAAEAFRPLVDFGDAPSSYDPVSGDPAVHEIDSTLNLGPAPRSVDKEWTTRGQTALANSDNYDDGISSVTVFDPTQSNYYVQVSVYNHTGANASLMGWLDYNGNGVFDPGEASNPVIVPSSTGIQTFNLIWTGISSPLGSGTHTYLRIRVSSTTLTSANATGYLKNGEVEDYRVLVDFMPLSVNIFDFNAKSTNNHTVSLNWSSAQEENFSGYRIERSEDGSVWKAIGFMPAKNNNSTGIQNYQFEDLNPLNGSNYYRLTLLNLDGTYEYSETRKVQLKDNITGFRILPNPAKMQAFINIESISPAEATIKVFNMTGETVLSQTLKLEAGFNKISISKIDRLPNGLYNVLLSTDKKIFTQKLWISK